MDILPRFVLSASMSKKIVSVISSCSTGEYIILRPLLTDRLVRLVGENAIVVELQTNAIAIRSSSIATFCFVRGEVL